MSGSPNLPSPAQAVLFLICSFSAVSIPCTANADIHFTSPVPSFEQALAAARQENKPLVVEMSATWCEPCQDLARDLERPTARRLLASLHLVVYEASTEEIGLALKQRLKVTGIPTLLAFARSGEELARIQGYSSWQAMEGWLRRVPTLAIPIDQLLANANAAPQNGQLQLDVAQRLMSDKKPDQARRYYVRAQQAGPKNISATAAWTLLQLSYSDQIYKLGQAQTEQLAAQYPGTPEAGDALVYLAALPQPPQSVLERLLPTHLSALSDPYEINSLAYTALKGGARKATVQVAERLAVHANEDPIFLDTLAEIAFYTEENLNKALALAERALRAAPSQQKERFARNLERFRRNKKEPCDEILYFQAPSIVLTEERPAPAQDKPQALPPLPDWMLARKKVETALGTDCWRQAAGTSALPRVLVLTGAKPGMHKLVFPKGTPSGWAACASKNIQATDLPGGFVLDITTSGFPTSFERLIVQAKQTVQTDCKHFANSPRLMFVLAAEAGQAPVLSLPAVESVTPALRACLENGFSALRPPRALMQSVSLSFR